MKKYSNKFFCFSPPVMIATFIIEIALAVYVLWRYKLTPASRVAVLMLVLLATFQLAEFMICGGWGMDGMLWSRVGHVAITLLPPLGIHLAYIIAKRVQIFGYGLFILLRRFLLGSSRLQHRP